MTDVPAPDAARPAAAPAGGRLWLPHERPTMPGSPYTPDHPAPLRLAYGLTSLLVAVTGGLGNGLVTANLQNLQGALGVTSAEIAWLPIVFVMTNAGMNLILVKFRQQFGIRHFVWLGLAGFVVTTVAHLLVNDFRSALLVRALSGAASAPLSTLGLLYMIQAFPAAHRLKGLVLGVGASQLALPLARLISPDLLAAGEWRALYLFELGLALVCFAAVVLVPLPPNDRAKVFDRLDFLTFALVAPGVALLCAVLGLGRIVWWGEAPWIGYALAGAVALLVPAFVIEHNRQRPLLDTRWLGSGDIVRIALSVILVRVALSEPTTGVVSLLTALGLTNEQFYGLFALVLAATAAGSIVSALTLDPDHLPRPVVISAAVIAVAALLDARATSLSRPENFLLSQALLAFAGALFIGPAMLAGVSRALARGPNTFVSFAVLFSLSQNLGGLAGGAFLGSLEVVRQREHLARLTQGLTLSDPQVAARVARGAAGYAGTLTDPALRNAEGAASLIATATREATVLAYNDVFRTVALVAAITGLWVLTLYVRRERARRAAARLESA